MPLIQRASGHSHERFVEASEAVPRLRGLDHGVSPESQEAHRWHLQVSIMVRWATELNPTNGEQSLVNSVFQAKPRSGLDKV
ncbi:uncharacterized protein ColSpa_07490 [Colletotrichum spaethianum]|uniref:Uncharacterized protein n=1 Tax=Colletotrichum spaethianum TaxID=700344 RepID=A0AA37LJ98_9PEZI|nr:uncharacterized protein ColSpa_07490 [Colletotrichum spaethianum]GKT47309.1 hypothetical protein ColSpa_07490 [Colletotrichum spaethianum]